MPSETLSLFPSPVSSIPSKSCLRHASDKEAGRDTTSPILNSKDYPSSGLRGLALHLTSSQTGEPERFESYNVSTESSVRYDPVTLRSVSGSQAGTIPTTSNTTEKDKRRTGPTVREISTSPEPWTSSSITSGSPTLVRSNSGMSTSWKSTSPPRPSLFPEYDPNLPPSQQPYYPTEQVRRVTPTRRLSYVSYSGDVASPSTPVATAGLSQLQALWNACNGQAPGYHGDQIRLALHRDGVGAGSTATELRFGSQEGRTLFSVSVAETVEEFTVRRHHPARTSILPIAQVELTANHSREASSTTIFSQQAALVALEAAAKTHKANSIAQFDPRASSPQAAQLAFDAVDEAKAEESCQLHRRPTGPNRFGVEQYRYELQHPRLGTFELCVEGDVDLLSRDSNKQPSTGQISLHLPSVSPAETTSTKTRAMMTFDTSAGLLDIDLASFRKLDSRYMIDSAMCAILTVALMESEIKKQNKPSTFPAPPTSPTEKTKTSRWRRRLSKRKGKGEKGDESEKETKTKLPTVTRGILFMLGFSFEAVVWLLSLGFKTLSKLVVCTSGIVMKK